VPTPSSSPRLLAGERILLTLWVGGLWAIGYMVAPALFANLDDRALAGSLAGVMFAIIAYVGLVCGGLLLLFNQLKSRGGWFNWRALVLVAMLLVTAAGHFYLAPLIAELRAAGLADSPEFARLHGVAAAGYLLTSLLGLLLVIAQPDSD
jgi:hypothetical protein